MTHLWLRAETKAFERRTPLLPHHAGHLVRHGHRVTVERSTNRIFRDSEYADQGCILADEGAWKDAPQDAFILGIKSLPESDAPLIHTHLYYAHVYKGQAGAEKILERFERGGGRLLDLEYLEDFRGNELATRHISFWAGVSGALAATKVRINKLEGQQPPFVLDEYYPSYDAAVHEVSTSLRGINRSEQEKVLIIGKGMTGSGAKAFFESVNITPTVWTREDTKRQAPSFDEILDFDMLMNCVVVDETTLRFVTPEMLERNRRLSVIGDISCDPDRSENPIPLYNHVTTFKDAAVRVTSRSGSVDVVGIDNLASLLPRESSIALASELFPYICQVLVLDSNFSDTPWQVASTKFEDYTARNGGHRLTAERHSPIPSNTVKGTGNGSSG